VEFSHRGRVDLGRYAWTPGARKTTAKAEKKRGTRK
jgi:hypothetical protein